jgi:hypothetical protein
MRLKLKTAIIASGRTQRFWSLHWQIPEGRLSGIVQGRVEPTLLEEQTIARGLRSSPEELFEDVRLEVEM